MHISQFIFMGLLVMAFIGGWMRAPRIMLGGTIGGVLGILIPFACSEIYVWRGGDPTAAGVFSFFCILTLPMGIGIGIAVAKWMEKRRRRDLDR